MTERMPLHFNQPARAAFLAILLAICTPDEGLAQRPRVLPAPKNREISFDSGLLIGGGLWNAPALPKIISTEADAVGSSGSSIDIANYRQESAAPFVLAVMRLFYPLESEGWPFGLNFQMSHALSETPLLFFTLSGNKASVRPQYALEGEMGIRYDWLYSRWRTDLGFDLKAARTFYLGANFTELGPSARIRATIDKALPKARVFGMIPLFSMELSGAPYLFVTGFDNRILTNGSGTLRDFDEVAYIAKSASALQFGVSLEAGGWWTDVNHSRKQNLLLVYSFKSTQYSGLIERQSSTAGLSALDVASTMHIVALSLRSSFL